MAELQVIQSGAQATIILGEKLVAANVPNLRDELKRLIEAGVTSMQLDCPQLSVLDSTGIGCLVAAYNTLAKINGSLEMTQVSADIHDLLCSMRLDRRIKMTPMITTRG